MATTKQNFVQVTTSVGGSAASVLVTASPQFAAVMGNALDKFVVDLSNSGYASNGGVLLALASSTPVTLDLTSFATGSTSNAGDTSFATVNQVIYNNFGTHDVTISPGASNPFAGPLSGTSPSFVVPAGSKTVWHNPAGWTVSGAVKTISLDPGANACSLAVLIGGA